MLSFFQGFNLARAIILICLAASCYVGFEVYTQRQELNELQDTLGLDSSGSFQPVPSENPQGQSWVEKKVRSIQQLGRDYTQKMSQLEGEGLKGQDTPQSYIRSVATKPRITLGALTINPTSQSDRGYKDFKYQIIPKSDADTRGKPTFDRTQIANFLYSLELGSARVKVTALDIRVPGRRNFEEHPPDLWEFTCELTERVKTD